MTQQSSSFFHFQPTLTLNWSTTIKTLSTFSKPRSSSPSVLKFQLFQKKYVTNVLVTGTGKTTKINQYNIWMCLNKLNSCLSISLTSCDILTEAHKGWLCISPSLWHFQKVSWEIPTSCLQTTKITSEFTVCISRKGGTEGWQRREAHIGAGMGRSLSFREHVHLTWVPFKGEEGGN